MYFIERVYRERKDFYYKVPLDLLNGKSYYEYDEDSYERLNWGTIYWTSLKNAKAKQYCLYDSNLWKSEIIRNKAYITITNFLKKPDTTCSSVTPLFPFEIYLMNDNFEMESFDKLNAINPGITIVADCKEDSEIHNPKAVMYSRFYKKEDKIIFLCFGFDKANFYFTSNKSYGVFQVNNDYSEYQNAINFKLPNLINK